MGTSSFRVASVRRGTAPTEAGQVKNEGNLRTVPTPNDSPVCTTRTPATVGTTTPLPNSDSAAEAHPNPTAPHETQVTSRPPRTRAHGRPTLATRRRVRRTRATMTAGPHERRDDHDGTENRLPAAVPPGSGPAPSGAQPPGFPPPRRRATRPGFPIPAAAQFPAPTPQPQSTPTPNLPPTTPPHPHPPPLRPRGPCADRPPAPTVVMCVCCDVCHPRSRVVAPGRRPPGARRVAVCGGAVRRSGK